MEALQRVADAYLMAGHEVEVLTLDAPDAPWLRGFPQPVHAVGPGVGWYRYSTRLVPCLKRMHRQFDLIVVNGIWQYSSFGAWRALHGTGTPYVIFTHGMLDPWFKVTYPLKHLKKWLYWPWGEYRVLRDAHAVLFTCEEERRLARQSFWYYKCRECVVGYGTLPHAGEQSAERTAFFQSFPGLRDRRVLLYLGRLHPKKGCDLLLRAFAQAREDRSASPLHLVMAGPGSAEYVAGLEKLGVALGLEAAGAITWTGHLEGVLKWGAIAAAEAFILPSHQENFGVAVAEALSCGVPVLISDKVNIWREIQESGAGLVDTDTQEGTVSLLRRWQRVSPVERERMKERAIDCFEQNFDIRETVRRMLELTAPRQNCALEVAS